jgi:hypothetical protein
LAQAPAESGDFAFIPILRVDQLRPPERR